MLNIISTRIKNGKICGPYKVLHNLIKGLDMIEYPYVVNRALNSTESIWIHDDTCAARYVQSISVNRIYGPNLYNNPTLIAKGIEFTHGTYLQPCEWARNIWHKMGFSDCPIVIWPVGIDTERFNVCSNEVRPRYDILLYHKKRSKKELSIVERKIANTNYTYIKLEYGIYTEQQYINAICNCRYIVWHGCPESQGIALLEALSMNKPILIIDANSIQDEIGYDKIYDALNSVVEVTTAPYFDSRCGMKIRSISELEESFEIMESKLDIYSPREYIMDNMSISGQTRKFINIIEDSKGSEKYKSKRIEKAWKEPHREKMRKYITRVSNKLLKRK